MNDLANPPSASQTVATPASPADAPAPAHPAVIHRADYLPPAWLVPEIALDFALSLTETRVQATLSVERNPAGDGARDSLVMIRKTA